MMTPSQSMSPPLNVGVVVLHLQVDLALGLRDGPEVQLEVTETPRVGVEDEVVPTIRLRFRSRPSGIFGSAVTIALYFIALIAYAVSFCQLVRSRPAVRPVAWTPPT